MPSVKLKHGVSIYYFSDILITLVIFLVPEKTQNNFTQIEQMSILKIDFKVQGEGVKVKDEMEQGIRVLHRQEFNSFSGCPWVSAVSISSELENTTGFDQLWTVSP